MQPSRNGAGTHASTSVVCLHASASSGHQWRVLQSRLTGRYRVFAPDLYGVADTPPWADEGGLTLADEVALLEPMFAAAGKSFHLIGHSYGGAVAARAALANPGRIRSLVLIEPVLFGLLIAEDPGQPAAREIVAVRDDTSAAADRGALESAGERFVDYWMGSGTWANMPSPRRVAVAQAMPNVRNEWSALFAEATPPVGVLVAQGAHALPGGQPVPGIRSRGREVAHQDAAGGDAGQGAGGRPHGTHHAS